MECWWHHWLWYVATHYTVIMARFSGDPGAFVLSMENIRLRGRFTGVDVKTPRLASNTQSVPVKVGGRTTDNTFHGHILFLDGNSADTPITSKTCSGSSFYSVCARKDKLIISGGYQDELNKLVADVHQFCFTSKKWQMLNAMPKPRNSHCSACVNDTLIILAGIYEESDSIKRYYKEVHILDLHTGVWTAMKECPIGVRQASITLINGVLFLIGGASAGLMSRKTYKLSLHDNKWTECSDIPASNQYAANSTVATQQYIYVLAYKDFCVYDVPPNQWCTLSSPLVPSIQCSLVLKNNTLVVMGGFEDTDEKPHKRVQCYDLRTKRWSLISDTLPLPLAYHTVITMEL